jgi:hypothetical protein
MFPSFNTPRSRFSTHAAAIAFLLISLSLCAQSTTPANPDRAAVPPVPVKVLIGLPGIGLNTVGDLSFTAKNLNFTTAYGSTNIPTRRILTVTAGDERVETGGMPGKIVRFALPYGSGYALGAITHKKVGLLTIEFLDAAGQYHGAVFALTPQDMDTALASLDFHPTTLAIPQPAAPTACPATQLQPNAVRVEVIDADNQSNFPAEDRALLYERLVQQLQSEKSILQVYRAGDHSYEAHCAEFTVTVRANTFNKGDQAVRASVGPLGHFVGTTRVSFHLTIASQDGTALFDQQMKNSEGSDTDSLNITKVISKTVVKNLKKSRTQLRKSQVA